LVLAKLTREGERLRATPICLLGEGDPVDLSLWQVPWAAQGKATSWFDRLRLQSTRRWDRAARTPSEAALAEGWRSLLDALEGGPGLAAHSAARTARIADRLAAYGMPVLAEALRGATAPEAQLRAAWAVLLMRQQMAAPPLLG
jgi:hypothetical protein